MALSILDGNQSATTLSTILSGGQHITAHTVVSLGTQAITDMQSAISGSVVSISNLPATQPVSIASVTIGNTVTISGTVTANPTGTQTIAGTVTANNTNLNRLVQDGDSTGTFGVPIVYAQLAGGELDYFKEVNQIDGLPIRNDANPLVVSGTVTIGAGTSQIGSVTASIIGTVPISISSVTIGNSITIGSCVTHGVTVANSSVTVNGTFFQATQPVSLTTLPALVAGTAQIGSVTASISNSVTIGSLPPISGTVTANVLGTRTFVDGNANTVSGFLAVGGWDAINAQFAPIPLTDSGGGVRIGFDDTYGAPLQVINHPSIPLSATVTVGNSVTIASLPAISGTVTANSSNGSLTTRFGSVTTANTAFATSAVTNSNRKYLLIQNITTASNAITVGIGFTPTTTQGIQLFAGAGLTFEGSYIPTGAVNLLSSVTASCYTILEA